MQKQVFESIASDQPVPLYFRVRESLKRDIREGIYQAHQIIPSETQLIQKYGVSRITIIRALSDLVKEGLLYRQQGKGTFVAPDKPRVTEQETVGLIMPMRGHIFESFSRSIVQGLAEHHVSYLLADVTGPFDERCVEDVRLLLQRKPQTVIIRGSREFPFQLLDTYKGNIIFIQNYECDKEYPATYILSDDKEGGRLIAAHLIERGHSHIVAVFSHPNRLEFKSYKRLVAGVRKVMTDHGLPETNMEVMTDIETAGSTLADRVRQGQRSFGVFTSMDSTAFKLCQILRRQHVSVPQDIAVVGYYNTPWCEQLDPPLTSVSIMEEEIARQAVNVVIGNEKAGKHIWIKPELVVRASS